MDCVCGQFRGWMGKTKYLSAFEQGMYGTAVGLCQELQHCWVFQAQQFTVCIKNDPPPKRHPAMITKLWGVGLWLNIRKVSLMFCTLSVSNPLWCATTGLWCWVWCVVFMCMYLTPGSSHRKNVLCSMCYMSSYSNSISLLLSTFG